MYWHARQAQLRSAFGKEAINLRVERRQVLATSISNSDTPDYRARDFDFFESWPRPQSGLLVPYNRAAMLLIPDMPNKLESVTASIGPNDSSQQVARGGGTNLYVKKD